MAAAAAAKSALLVIDMSVEQVRNVSYRKEAVLGSIKKLLGASSCSVLFDLRLDCRLWIERASQTSLSTVFPDVGHAHTPGAALIPELGEDMQFVQKLNFSAFYDAQLDSILKEHNIHDVYITGINTDYCVFATALDAFYHGLGVYVVSDCVSSIGGKAGHDEGLRRAAMHFGENSVVTLSDVIARLAF
jgi:nicotinamidase-related amidase